MKSLVVSLVAVLWVARASEVDVERRSASPPVTSTRWVSEALADVPRDKMVTLPQDAKKYLLQYGYYGPGITQGILDSLPSFLERYLTATAIAKYQKLMGIPNTGTMDNMTMKMMSIPRCGLSDTDAIDRMLDEENGVDSKRRRKRYVLQGRRWRRSQFPLSYRLETPTDKLDADAQERAFTTALRYWSDAGRVSFRRIASGRPDMAIGFQTRNHNDRNNFDGRGRVLAHAFYPGRYRLAGDAHFDDDERWVIRRRGGQDLLPTAIHEFGHSLGLSHSDVRGSIMWPTAGPFRRTISLHQDDIDGIRALYGAPDNTEATTRRPVSRPTSRPSPTTDICDGRIDAIIYNSDNEDTMAFKGNEVYMLERNGGIADGFPRLISDEFVGFPENTRVNAAVLINDRMHLFTAGNRLYRADEEGRFQGASIPQSEIGIPDDMQIRAAFDSSLFSKAYLFTDSQYYRYTSTTGSLDDGYPKPITAWEGLPDGADLDAVTTWRNGRVYFFYGPNYYRFNVRQGMVDTGYPRTNADNWFGCDA